MFKYSSGQDVTFPFNPNVNEDDSAKRIAHSLEYIATAISRMDHNLDYLARVIAEGQKQRPR